MKHPSRILRDLTILSVATLTCQFGFAQEGPPAPEVTEHHKVLHKENGNWSGEMKIWMSPDAPPMSMPFTESNKLLGDGLWIMSEFESGPFQGRGQFGYDPQTKKYMGTWIDNMSPHMSIMEGDYDKDKQLMTWHSKVFDVMAKKTKYNKSTVKFNEDGTRLFTMYQRYDENGEWAKSFEMHYKKKTA